MGKLKKMIPYLSVIVVNFYVLPLFIFNDTGLAMLLMLVILPLICFVCSLIYGVKNRFNLLYSIFVAVLFAPTLWIFYNYTAWVYIVGYGINSLIGNALGAFLANIINNHKSKKPFNHK